VSTAIDLPDLNVWLASADHSHYQQAVHYWEKQAAEQVLFCIVTALGLVRLVRQPKLMGAAVIRGRSFEAAAGVLPAARGEPGEVGARWLRGVSPASAKQGSARSALHRCLPGGPSDGQRMAAGEL
jgi:hypothetical protein